MRATRLLAIHSGALGDVVLFAQFLQAVRGGCRSVALAAGAEKAGPLAALGVIDEALDFEALPMHEVFSADRPLSDCTLGARLGRCDRLVSCFAAGDGRAERRLAEMCGAGRAVFLPIRPGPDARRHLMDLWFDRLDRAGVPSDVRAGRTGVDLRRWSVTPATRAEGRRLLHAAGVDPQAGFVALHVGSGSPGKCWPLPAFEALADRLSRPVVLVLGPVERRRLGEQTIARLRSGRAILAEPTLVGLAAVLAEATAFVGNDSGPSHLSAALGTPTVALFGPTDPVHFAPRGRCVRTLRHEPLADLPAGRVAEAIGQLPCRPDPGATVGSVG